MINSVTRWATRLLVAPLMAAALVLAFTAPPATAAPPATGSVTTPVSGLVNGASSLGTLTIQQFVNQAGQLLAVGDLTLGGVDLGQVTAPINLADSSGSCDILHLDLGPLDLDLLGLQVHLNEVVLDIVAQSGAGNLLGNLLCAVAHLLDNTGNPLGGLTALLNRLLGALG